LIKRVVLEGFFWWINFDEKTLPMKSG
jgi:hypothetical protein